MLKLSRNIRQHNQAVLNFLRIPLLAIFSVLLTVTSAMSDDRLKIGLGDNMNGAEKVETLEQRFKNPQPKPYLAGTANSRDDSSKGLIYVEADLGGKDVIDIFIDHYRLSQIHDQESKTYQVLPGIHEVQVGTDFYASKPVSLQVSAGETRRLQCVCEHQGPKNDVLEVHRNLFRRRKIYFIRELPGTEPAQRPQL